MIVIKVITLFIVSLEKFVINYNINRETVPMMRSVLMIKLTRDFSPGDDPERKMALFFLNFESAINKLHVEGDYTREDAVELHLKKYGS